MLPAIGWQARLAFRDLDPEAREEAVEEAVAVAKRFRISPGRVSQLRNELAASWRQLQGEPAAECAIAGAASFFARHGRCPRGSLQLGAGS